MHQDILNSPKSFAYLTNVLFAILCLKNPTKKTNFRFLSYAVFVKTRFDNNFGLSCFQLIF